MANTKQKSEERIHTIMKREGEVRLEVAYLLVFITVFLCRICLDLSFAHSALNLGL